MKGLSQIVGPGKLNPRFVFASLAEPSDINAVVFDGEARAGVGAGVQMPTVVRHTYFWNKCLSAVIGNRNHQVANVAIENFAPGDDDLVLRTECDSRTAARTCRQRNSMRLIERGSAVG